MYEIVYKLYGEPKSVQFTAKSERNAEIKAGVIAAAIGAQRYELRKLNG